MAEPTLPDADAGDTARWRLNLCGRAQVLSPRDEHHDLERRDAAMLALLALDGPTPRARVLALLWPDEPPERVRSRLRQRIFALKRRFGVELVVGASTLALAPGVATLDDDDAGRPLLADHDHADLPEFAQWLALARERRQQRRRERLAGEASALERQGRLAEAIVAAERLIELEPLLEHTHRRLMRLHHLRGDRAAALLAFDRCEQLLKHEIGTRPSAETLELLAQVDSVRAPALAVPRMPPTVLRPPRLVGRADEWSALVDAWTAGVPAVLLGDAGLGKTRLLGELVAAHADAVIVQAPSRPGDVAVPYALLARLLRALLPLAGEPARGVRSELARVLPELGDAPREESEARFQAAIELTLQRATAQGLRAVVLDDLHFSDAASLEMVHRLAGAGGVNWLFALRPAEASPGALTLVAETEGHWRGRCVRLAPLSAEAVAELVDSLGIAGLDGATLAPQLLRRTGGNPLFVLEALKHELHAGDGSLAPETVTMLMTRRIEQLSREAVRVARCAAIAGQDLTAGLVAAVLDVNVLDLADAWAELEQAQVLRDGAFAHDLVADAARASVPASIARELHRRIAERLEAARAPAARVAAHWLGAGDEARAAPCLVDAARAARRALRVREAMDDFERAQRIHESQGDLERQLELIDEFTDLAMVAGRSDALQRQCERALERSRDDRQRAMACTALSCVAGGRGDFVTAAQWGERAVTHATASQDRRTEFEARCRLAILQGPLGRADAAVAVLAPIEPWVRHQVDARLRIRFHDAHAMAMSAAGRMHEAIPEWQAAAALARSSGDALALPELTMQIAMAHFFLGRTEAGRRMADGIVRDLDALPGGSVFSRQVLRSVLAMDRDLARYESALATSQRLLDDPDATAHERDNARLYGAAVYIELGQPARARQLLEQAEADGAIPINDVFWNPLRVELAAGRPDAAEVRASAVRAAHAAAEGRSGRTLYPVRRLLARWADDPAVAIEAAQCGLDTAARSDAQGHIVVFKTLLAHRLAAGGDARTATRLAREAWATPADIAPASVYQAQVWLWLHEVLAPHDERLAQHIVRHATDWILRTAAQRVPVAFRASFLHRQPVNVALLRLAQGEPVPAGHGMDLGGETPATLTPR